MTKRTWMAAIAAVTLALASVALVSAPTTVHAGPGGEVASVAGPWTTDWGGQVAILTLQQNGNVISGGYTTTGAPPGNVSGMLSGNVISGTWNDQGGSVGAFRFVFAPDFRSFRGTWGSGSSAENGGNWDGRR